MRVLLLAALVGIAAFSQTAPKKPAPSPAKKAPAAPTATVPPNRWPIDSLSVEGNHNFSREQVLAIAGLKVGQVAGRTEFETAREKLLGCGAFETVAYKFAPGANGGYAAVFQVTEVQQVYPADLFSLGVSSVDLEAYLKTRDPLFAQGKLPATTPVFERYSRWIQEYLASKGIKDTITGSVVPTTAGDFAIQFRSDRPLPSVAQVSFEGNKVIEDSKLLETIVGPAIGSQFTEDLFRQILNSSIRPLYEAKGYVRVAFPNLRTEKASGAQGVHVFVTVEEGEQYKIGKVQVDGEPPVPAADLLKTAAIPANEAYNSETVAQAVERIRKRVFREGYLKANVGSVRKIDDDKRLVDVTLHVSPGPRFKMGKLNIEGLDLQGEPAMRRIWTMKEGSPFNPDYPDQFLQRVREGAMFDNLGSTKADTKVNEQSQTVDVTLTFKGPGPAPGGRGRGPGRGY